MKDEIGLVLLIVIAVVAVVAGITYAAVRQSWERDAISNGHAEYYIDKDYEKRWRWLPVKEE